MSNRFISVAIPFYNNSNYINDLLENIINDKRITEIVICDDKSNNNELNKLKKIICQYNSNKIKLFENTENLGCYHNKLNTLSKCSNEWACLIDSDNIINKVYIDKLYEYENWDINLIYAPMWAYTFGETINELASKNLNYSQFKNEYIDRIKYIQYFNSGNINFKCLINTCNYFLPVNKYLSIMKKYNYERTKIDCLDSNVLFADWIHDNNKVYIVNGLIYKHRLHSQSNYTLSPSKKYSTIVESEILQKLNTIK